MGFWPIVLNVIRNSDVVLLLVDSRMPEVTRNSEIIEKAEELGKRINLVFTKCDLISPKERKKLEATHPNSHVISGLRKTGVARLKEYLENLADNWEQDSLRVGIVGYPNVGKSTLINLLVPSALAKVSSKSGTTRKTQWLRKGNLRIMDSPGVIPFGDGNIKLGLTASKDPHKLRNPEDIAVKIIEYLRERGSNTLEKHYGVKTVESAYDMMIEIGKKKGCLLKGGDVDERRIAIKIIDEWQKGKISLK